MLHYGNISMYNFIETQLTGQCSLSLSVHILVRTDTGLESTNNLFAFKYDVIDFWNE